MTRPFNPGAATLWATSNERELPVFELVVWFWFRDTFFVTEESSSCSWDSCPVAQWKLLLWHGCGGSSTENCVMSLKQLTTGFVRATWNSLACASNGQHSLAQSYLRSKPVGNAHNVRLVKNSKLVGAWSSLSLSSLLAQWALNYLANLQSKW